MPATVKDLEARWGQMQAEFDLYRATLADIAAYMAPRRLKAITGTEQGAKLTAAIFDSEGHYVPTLLAASLHNNLTNPAQKWQSLLMRQDELNTVHGIQNWLAEISTRFDKALAATNFTNEAGEFYLDLPVFGTAAMLMEPIHLPRGRTVTMRKNRNGTYVEDARALTFGGWRFRTLPIGSYLIAEDGNGIVQTLFREFQMPQGEVVARWPGTAPRQLKEAAEKEPDKRVPIRHAVYPRPERAYGRADRGNMEWAVCYWTKAGESTLLEEGGSRRFRYLVARWSKNPDETYGRGQGELALPDVKTLNTEVEYMLAQAALDIAPPLFERENAVKGILRWEPAARNVVMGDPATAVHTQTSGARFDTSKFEVDRIAAKIRELFFVDQIKMLPPLEQKIGGISPLEIAKRYEQVFGILGPNYGRLTTDFLKPMVEMGVWDLWFGGALTPPPPELAETPDADIDIQYEGPLARAQKAKELEAIDRALGYCQAFLAINPESRILDNLDEDAAFEVMAQVTGLSPKITRGREVVGALREQRSRVLAQMQQQEQMMAMAQGAGKAAPMVKALQAPTGQPAGATA